MEPRTTEAHPNNNNSASKDPAAVWWGDAAGKDVPESVQLAPTVMPAHVEEPWRWRYSPWVGIMYGPIPVGLIVGLPILLALAAR